VVLGFSVNVLNGGLSGEKALVSDYSKSRTVRYAQGNGDLTDELDGWLQQHVALYRDRSVLRQPFSGPSASSVYDPPLSTDGWNKGFVEGRLRSDAAATATAVAEIKGAILANYDVSQGKTEALGQLIDRLRSEGAQVVLVTMPVSADFIAAVPGGSPSYQAALGRLLEVGLRHGAVTARAGEWPAADFADAGHLNQAGTARMTAWLSSELSRVLGAGT
jgi:hypothetical protein